MRLKKVLFRFAEWLVSLDLAWRAKLIFKRLWCRIVGHRLREFTWFERVDTRNTHICQRCLKLWQDSSQ